MSGKAKADRHPWRKAALIHQSFWLLPLGQKDRLCYLYLSTFCSNKPWPVSLTIMARALSMDVKRVHASVGVLIALQMVKRTERTGRASLFWVLDMGPNWGQPRCKRTHHLGANAPTHLGANAPTHLGANAPTNYISLNTDAKASTVDNALLAIFKKHFGGWRFNRKPIGRRFVFTRPMVAKAVECMRYLNQTMHTTEAFESFLAGCGEYMALPRDVLSDGRDQRALSPVQWLNHWPEQIRLAGIYQDEKAEKVTRISLGLSGSSS